MTDAVVKYVEEQGATANTTSWVDTATLANSEFEANKTYLILANQICKHASAAQESRVRLVHGTTPTVFDDASLAWEGLNGTQEHEMSYMFLFTQPATAELVKLQISSSSTTTVTSIFSQILVLKLSDDFVSGTDYFWDEDLVDYTMTGTPTRKAETASFTPNGTDRWLFIGHIIYDVVNITTATAYDIYDSGPPAPRSNCSVEGEDGSNDFIGVITYWSGVPTNVARTVSVRVSNSAGATILLASRVLAINLSKFAQSASIFETTEIDPSTTPVYTTLATLAPTPSATGNWVYLGHSIMDVNETSTNLETRLQVNPDGGGLISDPNYPTTPPSIDNWDASDEVPFSIFKLRSLTSGAARTINWDCRQVAGTLGRCEDNGLAAFSVTLAGPPPDEDNPAPRTGGLSEFTRIVEIGHDNVNIY